MLLATCCSIAHKQINIYSHPQRERRKKKIESERERKQKQKKRRETAVTIASQCEMSESSLNFKDQTEASSDKRAFV